MCNRPKKPNTPRRILWRVTRTLALAYVASCLFVYVFQDKMLYRPTVQSPVEAQADFDLRLLTPWPDLENYRALFGPGPAMDSGPTIIYLHGNGGTAAGQAAMIAHFRPLGGRVFLYEFPGYGPRSGAISEASYVTDLATTIDMLKAERPGPVVLVGSSLGSAVACGALKHSQTKVDAVVLFTPFTTLAAAAASVYWYLPTQYLVRETYDNLRALADYDGRLAVIVAERDTTTEARFGRELINSFSGPKRLWEVAGARHNDWFDLMTREQWAELNAWLIDELQLGPEADQ